MSILLAVAAAGITYISDPEIELTPSEAVDIGIQVSAVDLEAEYLHPYPLFLVNVNLSNFDLCAVRDVTIEFGDALGQLVFASSLGARSSEYTFQLQGRYMDLAKLAVQCESGPDDQGMRYLIEPDAFVRVASQ